MASITSRLSNNLSADSAGLASSGIAGERAAELQGNYRGIICKRLGVRHFAWHARRGLPRAIEPHLPADFSAGQESADEGLR
jgi:hypothetical protein